MTLIFLSNHHLFFCFFYGDLTKVVRNLPNCVGVDERHRWGSKKTSYNDWWTFQKMLDDISTRDRMTDVRSLPPNICGHIVLGTTEKIIFYSLLRNIGHRIKETKEGKCQSEKIFWCFIDVDESLSQWRKYLAWIKHIIVCWMKWFMFTSVDQQTWSVN